MQGSLVQPAAKPIEPKNQTLPSKFFVVVIACLSFIIFLQTIAIIIILTNFTSSAKPTTSDDTGSVPRENINATFDSNGELATFNAVCVTNNGAYFKIFKSGTYEQYDASANLINSGNYSMVNGIVVSISPNRALYYDGYYLADGTTIYDCEADNNTEMSE